MKTLRVWTLIFALILPLIVTLKKLLTPNLPERERTMEVFRIEFFELSPPVEVRHTPYFFAA